MSACISIGSCHIICLFVCLSAYLCDRLLWQLTCADLRPVFFFCPNFLSVSKFTYLLHNYSFFSIFFCKFSYFSFSLGNFTSTENFDEKTMQRFSSFAGGREAVFYTEELQNAHHIHIPGSEEHRILQHHYAFAFFADTAMQSFYRRFVRDYMRYKGIIFSILISVQYTILFCLTFLYFITWSAISRYFYLISHERNLLSKECCPVLDSEVFLDSEFVHDSEFVLDSEFQFDFGSFVVSFLLLHFLSYILFQMSFNVRELI